jgi:hypothetical protein
MPSTLGSWPTAMVSPSPNMKPVCTLKARNWETKPSRKRPSRANVAPITRARVAERATKRTGSPAAIVPTMAAEMAAVDDVGETISCRDVPSRE